MDFERPDCYSRENTGKRKSESPVNKRKRTEFKRERKEMQNPLNINSLFQIRLTETGYEWCYVELDNDRPISEAALTVFEKAILVRIRTRTYNYRQFVENPNKWFSFRLILDQLD